MDQQINSKPKNQCNLITTAKDYIENMLSETTGRKALILDNDTLTIVSMVYSKTRIL